MNRSMKLGRDTAEPILNQLLAAAQRSDEPAMFWTGAISLLCGGMAAQAGAEVTREVLSLFADNICTALNGADLTQTVRTDPSAG